MEENKLPSVRLSFPYWEHLWITPLGSMSFLSGSDEGSWVLEYKTCIVYTSRKIRIAFCGPALAAVADSLVPYPSCWEETDSLTHTLTSNLHPASSIQHPAFNIMYHPASFYSYTFSPFLIIRLYNGQARIHAMVFMLLNDLLILCFRNDTFILLLI